MTLWDACNDPTLESDPMRLTATKSLIVLISIYLVRTSSSFAQGTPLAAAAAESPSSTQKPSLAEKIRDVSPNGKFAMRISYDAEAYQKMFPPEKSNTGKASAALEQGIKEEYFFSTIKAIDLVSLSTKSVVTELPWDGSAEQMNLTWSRDSKWCAFYASTSRWGLTWVYHLHGDKFVPISENTEPKAEAEGDAHGTWIAPLEIEVDGGVRREWLKPVRWVKPGVLLLEQSVIFRNPEADEATYRLTAAFDEKTGKFRIISKKKVLSKDQANVH
jgi:hypothetical protein